MSRMVRSGLILTWLAVFWVDFSASFQSFLGMRFEKPEFSRVRSRAHTDFEVSKAIRKGSQITGLRASFVPLKEAGEFASEPDHPVLKDPIVLEDQMTKERVSIGHAGAQILSYMTPDYDVLAIRPDAVLDGTKPISGGVPMCFPQFGPGPLPQHGFARNLKWSCLDAREESAGGSRGLSFLRNNAKTVFELTDSNQTRQMWPHKFNCQYVVELNAGCLTIDFRVINPADTDLTFTAALHTYFAVDDIDQIRIVGLQGKEYLDKAVNPPVTKTEDSKELTIKGFTERVYINAAERVELVDGAKSVDMKSQGWEDLVVWSPYGKEEMGFRKFVCIEHGCIKKPVTVGPRELWNAVVEIRPRKDGSPAWLSALPDTEQ